MPWPLKDARPEELLAGIRAVAAGDAVIAPAPTRRIVDEYAEHVPAGRSDASEDPRLTSLTDREREILVAIGKAGPTARSPPVSSCPSPP